MKKIYSLLLVILILFSFTACSSNISTSEDSVETVSKINFGEQKSNNKKEDNSDNEEKRITTDDGAPVAGQNISEDFSIMRNPVDSLIRCMIENNMEYEPRNPVFFWKAIFYFASGYGEGEELTEVYDNEIKISRQKVQEYATVLFYDYDDLMEIPEEVSNFVTYDESYDAYIFKRGDVGLAYSSIESVKNTDNGYNVVADFYTMGDKNMELDSKWNVEMVDNPYVSGITELKYLYTIKSIEKQ